MASPANSPILKLLRGVLLDRRAEGCPDPELLRRFLAERDRAALEALIARHGPMVLDVCRGELSSEADAEDAFQATFLVLARRAKSIREPASLANWLYGVAHHVARKARTEFARRQKHENNARAARPEAEAPDDLSWRKVRRVMHEELMRLPERYRGALVVCYLEGKSQDEAAAQLGLPKGTLKGHLERGRALLRRRLERRGLGAVALLVAAAWPRAEAAVVPGSLAGFTAKAALGYSLGRAVAGGVVSARVAFLAEGVRRTMLESALKVAAVAFVALGLIGAGALSRQLAGAQTGREHSGGADVPMPREGPRKANPAPGATAAGLAVTVTGRVLGPAGKPVARTRVAVVSWTGASLG